MPRTFLILLSCLLAAAPVLAQEVKDGMPKCPAATGWTKFEEDAVYQLVDLWQREENETVRKQAARTLRQMGPELAPVLVCVLVKEYRKAAASADKAKHFATVQFLASILGQLGNPLAREDTVRRSLIVLVQRMDTMPSEVRQAAVEALGRIFANKSIFLILNREEFWLKEELSEKTPREMAHTLQNEAATLKEKFDPLKPLAPEKARELILLARNTGRTIRLYRNVIALWNELEPQQEKDLPTRIISHLTEIENNLLIVATAAKVEEVREAAAKAEQKAHALYEEMERINYNIVRWQELNKGTSEAISALRATLDDPSPMIRYSAAEALGRIYGKGD